MVDLEHRLKEAEVIIGSLVETTTKLFFQVELSDIRIQLLEHDRASCKAGPHDTCDRCEKLFDKLQVALRNAAQ